LSGEDSELNPLERGLKSGKKEGVVRLMKPESGDATAFTFLRDCLGEGSLDAWFELLINNLPALLAEPSRVVPHRAEKERDLLLVVFGAGAKFPIFAHEDGNAGGKITQIRKELITQPQNEVGHNASTDAERPEQRG